MKKLVLLLSCLLSVAGLQAQDTPMADVMRSNGKIYVVVGVLMIIFLGLITFMVILDRRLTKLEKKQKSE